YICYLRVLVNPNDEEALKRIINYPARGIGKTSVDRAILAANENNIPLWQVLERAREFGYKGGTLEAIENFVIMSRSFSSMLQHKNAYEVAVHVGKQTNFVRELFNDKSTEGVARYENIQELLNSIKEWVESASVSIVDDEIAADGQAPDDNRSLELTNEENTEVPQDADENNEVPETEDKSLGAYLQQITLLTDADNKNADADTVKLMTIHAAKGLEFGCVFA